MVKVHHVKKARKDYPEAGIKKGDSYYWWKKRYGGIHRSKTRPTRQQLTSSPFLASVYDIEDTIADFSVEIEGKSVDEIREEIENFIDSVVSDLQDLQSECEDSLYNMPEQLQETSEAGMLLQERIDMLEEWADELLSISVDIDDDMSKEEIKDRVNEIIDEIINAGGI